MARLRRASAVTTPPALRITWASPSRRPSRPYTLRRASMQASTATCRAGGRGRSPWVKVRAYASALVNSSSVVLTDHPLVGARIETRRCSDRQQWTVRAWARPAGSPTCVRVRCGDLSRAWWPGRRRRARAMRGYGRAPTLDRSWEDSGGSGRLPASTRDRPAVSTAAAGHEQEVDEAALDEADASAHGMGRYRGGGLAVHRL